MPSLRAWLCLVLLGLASLGASASPAATVPRPAWAPGDFWTYATNTTLTAGFNLTGTVTSRMTGTQGISLGGVSVQAIRLVLDGSGTATGEFNDANGSATVSGQWILTGENLLEPTNLQVVYRLVDVSVNGTYQHVLPFTLRVQNTTTFEVLSNGWPYPLAEGGQGDVVVAYNFTQDLHSSVLGDRHASGAGRWTLHYSMGSAVSVAAPAGSFLTHPVTETWPDGSSERTYFSPDVGNNVRTEDYDGHGGLVATTALASYRYQATEPPTFLGLTLVQWEVVLPVAASVAVVGFVLWRRARRKRTEPPGLT